VILTPGQLYFINEQDIKTGTHSSYYKIGIVRDAAGRDSKNRLLEHQTGNPRKLCIVEALTMPGVEAIETNLHYLFARNRVMGEWMHFSDSELQSAIKKAKELAAEMEENIEDYKFAEILKNTKSNGQKLDATEEAEEWYATIQDLKEVIEACEDALGQYDDYLYEAIERGIDVSGRAKVQTRAGAKKFDENLFAQTYPELYNKYSSSAFPIKGSFRVKAAKDWNPDLSAINQEQVELLIEFKDQLLNADHSMDTGFALHEKHLGVLEIKKYAEWKSEIANMKLRVLTGEAEGIEGICTWKREEKEVVSFDRQKLENEFPDEYNACVVQGSETIALIVEPKIAQG
jgi:rubrerythrin